MVTPTLSSKYSLPLLRISLWYPHNVDYLIHVARFPGGLSLARAWQQNGSVYSGPGPCTLEEEIEFRNGWWVNVLLEINLKHTPVIKLPSCQFFQKESVRLLPRLMNYHLMNYLLPHFVIFRIKWPWHLDFKFATSWTMKLNCTHVCIIIDNRNAIWHTRTQNHCM